MAYPAYVNGSSVYEVTVGMVLTKTGHVPISLERAARDISLERSHLRLGTGFVPRYPDDTHLTNPYPEREDADGA